MRILSLALFFLTFFLLYGGLHVYFFRKLKRAFHPEGTGKVLIVSALVLLFLSSPIIRVTEKVGLEAVAKFFAWVGYDWMGFLFLFFSASLLLDAWALLLWTAGRIWKRNFPALLPPPRWAFAGPLLIGGVLSLYGFYEAGNIVVERITIRSSKISDQVGRVRIAQISDVHIGILIGKERMQSLIEKIRKESPDILVSTGDLVDGQLDGMAGAAEPFKAFQPRFGKFAITGNHEFYAGIGQAVDFTKSAGFSVLRGEGMTIAGVLNVVGVDDDTGRNSDSYRPANEKELLAKLPRRYFTLLLKHKPFIDKEAVEFFDLQLSGHTHKGQIFPFNLITRVFFPLHAGYFRFLNSSHLYVSRGTGTWGPPMRLLSPPEVTIIDLLPAQRP